jgi:23S rRNA (adenine2503-C2)-methyltransferase
MTQSLVGLEVAEIQRLLGEAPVYRARQLYQALYRANANSLDDVSTLPKSLRMKLGSNWTVGRPTLSGEFLSSDGTCRYLLTLEQDGRTIETVFMPEERRDTICVSTQVGCPVDCKFCLTALMGLERNLTAGEIVSQVQFVLGRHRLDPRSSQLSIVMMGMGEPLLNLANVLKATRILTDEEGCGVSVRRITLSTAGIVPKLAELGRADIRPKLAISLNASTEGQRRELMPITRKYHLSDLLEACRAYPLRSWERLTIEYVLLKGVNDSDADARRVVRLLADLKCKVNLIALNPGPGIPFESPDEGRIHAFQAILKRAFPCFIRKPRGRDVYAACGQLKRMTSDTPNLVSVRT